MDTNIQPFSDPEHEAKPHRNLSYRRPAYSSLVATVAVAFAFFLLGGFIKTYRQLQALREESRREIAELRDAVRRLQFASGTGSQREGMPASRTARRGDPEPERVARAERLSRVAAGSRNGGRDGLRNEDPGNATESTIADLPAFDDPEPRGIRYQWGRRSGIEASRALLSSSGGPCQVISVAAAGKRIMIEGGRDLGLAEGMRLELCRDGRWIGDLRVVDVFDTQSSCEVLHATFNPEPGDTVRTPEKSM